MNFIEVNNMKFNELHKLINFKVFLEKILNIFQHKDNSEVKVFELYINVLCSIYKDLNKDLDKDRFITRTMRMVAIY
jgi:hypothetical protein